MRLILLIAVSVIQLSAMAQPADFGNKAKIYLVRHAEKGPGDDPLLTDRGNKRAGELVKLLKNKKIARIYVTEFRRTQNTGDSLRIQLGVDTAHYFSDTARIDELLGKIRANNDMNKHILIIGHSNTIPLIIRKLGLPAYPAANIPDDQFNNVFLVTYKNGKAFLKKTIYGK